MSGWLQSWLGSTFEKCSLKIQDVSLGRGTTAGHRSYHTRYSTSRSVGVCDGLVFLRSTSGGQQASSHLDFTQIGGDYSWSGTIRPAEPFLKQAGSLRRAHISCGRISCHLDTPVGKLPGLYFLAVFQMRNVSASDGGRPRVRSRSLKKKK